MRLIRVDALEVDLERGLEPYGEEAACFMKRSLDDQKATLEFDVEREDDHGRLLAYAYLSDGSLFKEMLLQEGYAQIAIFPPNTRHLYSFEVARVEARKERREGLDYPRISFADQEIEETGSVGVRMRGRSRTLSLPIACSPTAQRTRRLSSSGRQG